MTKQRGSLHIAESGGKTYVATAANLKWLIILIQQKEGWELVTLVEGVDRTTGRPWIWVNPPKGAPSSGPKGVGKHNTKSVDREAMVRIEEKLDRILEMIGGE